MVDVTGVRLKLSRAMEHLLELDDEVGAYLDTDPFRPLREEDARYPNRVTISLRLATEPPLHIAAVGGDVVNNLRSGLDHLAWQLVLSAGGTPTDRTQFPIHANRLNAKGRPRVVAIDGGVSREALSVVESVQPYHRRADPAAHPLAILQTLSNRDKHRTLVVTAAKSRNVNAYLQAPDGGSRVGGLFHPGLAGVGDVVGVFEFPEGTPLDPDVDLVTSGESFVIFAEEDVPSGSQPVLMLLEEVSQYVERIVTRLEAR